MKRVVMTVALGLFCVQGFASQGPRPELSPGQRQALDELAPLLKEVRLGDEGVPSWLSGDLGPAAGTPTAAALDAVRRLAPAFRATVHDGFEATSDLTDSLGQTHVRLQQRYRGLKVIGGELIVHLAGGRIIGVNGRFRPDIDVSPNPELPADAALDRALRGRAYTQVRTLGQPELVISAGAGRSSRLAWRQTLSYVDPTGAPQTDRVYGDARTGAFLGSTTLVAGIKDRKIHDGTGISIGTLFGDLRGTCNLGLPGPFLFGEGGPTTPPPADVNAVGAYNKLGQVYEYYKNVFGRDSIKGTGEPIVASVHVGHRAYNSASLNSPNYASGMGWIYDCSADPANGMLLFGDGDGVTYARTVRSLDVVAHEYTHGIIASTAGLDIGQQAFEEAGALNESFADALGVGVEYYYKGATDWKIGEDIYLATNPNLPPGDHAAIRYMYNPPLDSGQYAAFTSVNYYPHRYYGPLLPCVPNTIDCVPNSGNDFHAVHYNSGIGNLAFYLLAEGGHHPVSKMDVVGIGLPLASRIWYRAVTAYMVSTDGFGDARNATVHAAADLDAAGGGVHSPTVDAVEKAWDAVAVPRKDFCVDANGNPVACTIYNAVKNWGFESFGIFGATTNLSLYWTAQPTSIIDRYWNQEEDHTPGGYGKATLDRTGTLSQVVQIEGTAAKATLVFFLAVRTLGYGTQAVDSLTVEAENLTTHQRITLPTITNLDETVPSSQPLTGAHYVRYLSDLTPLKGAPVKLTFQATVTHPYSDPTGPYTMFYVDDVKIGIR
jgi:Zn-dependent metalloprotease